MGERGRAGWRCWSWGSRTCGTSWLSLHCPDWSHWSWFCLFPEIICTTQVSPHRSLLQSWNFVIWDQLRANTTIIAVTSQPCNQSEIILRMHRAKQWRPTNRIFLIDPSPPLFRERPACSVPAFQSDSDFVLSSTVLLQRPPEERRRESETDSRRLLWYCVEQDCTGLYRTVHRYTVLYSQRPPSSSSSPPV